MNRKKRPVFAKMFHTVSWVLWIFAPHKVWGVDVEMSLYLRRYKYLVKEVY